MSGSLRVLFLASRDGSHPEAAGGDLLLDGLATGLAARGHDVIYACLARAGVPAVEEADGVQIVRGRGALGQAAWAAGRYARDWRHRVDVVVQEAIGGLTIPYAAPLYIRGPLVAFWYQHNASLFQAQFTAPVAAMLSLAEWGLARLHRRALIATPSAFQAERLRMLGFRAEQVAVVPPPLMPIATGTPGAVETRAPLVLFLGKLRRYKHPHDLLEVADRLRTRVPEARYVIAGRPDGSGLDRWLEREIQRRGIGNRVTLRRSVTDVEKHRLLGRARVLVCPSPTEGFGLAVAEALQHGTPAVVSEGFPPEVVAEGVSGLRAPFGDVEALTSAVERLLRDDALWTRLSAGAQQEARRLLRESPADAIETLLRRAVAQKAPSGAVWPLPDLPTAPK